MQTSYAVPKAPEVQKTVDEAMDTIVSLVESKGLEDRFLQDMVPHPHGFIYQHSPLVGLQKLFGHPHDYAHSRRIEVYVDKVSRNDGAVDADFVDPSAFSEERLVFAHSKNGKIESELMSVVIKRNGWETKVYVKDVTTEFVNNKMLVR